MNLNDLANLGQIIGALAVVISLFYVASQIRQNTNAVRSATAQTVHEHFAKWYHLVAANDELAQIVAQGLGKLIISANQVEPFGEVLVHGLGGGRALRQMVPLGCR